MTHPNQYNVSLGDLLITFLHDNSLARLVVTETTPESISASKSNLATASSYQEAIVRKENGTYLIGENAWARLLGRLGNNGFGGIRLIR